MAAETEWKPFAEPWRTTALRNGTIVVAIALAVGLSTRQMASVIFASVLALWFTLGGHGLEILYRNHLHPLIGGPPPVQAMTRLAYWFGGGSLLYAGALATLALLAIRKTLPGPWWLGGVVFVGLELVVHLLLLARGQPGFFNGRG